MKYGNLLTVLFVPLLACCGSGGGGTAEADYDVVPKLRSVVVADSGQFVLDKNTVIVPAAGCDGAERIAAFLNDYVEETTGYKLKVSEAGGDGNLIRLSVDSVSLSREAYAVSVSGQCMDVTGGSYQGLFHAVQTLRKSMPVERCGKVSFPAARIEDEPAMSYRGMHLDVSRHFFTVEQVKQYIDIMALHNLNVFHWHLTDDQGWRIEIKKYPLLTEIGSKRKESLLTGGQKGRDGIPYGGFYTQEEIKDVIGYAAERGIEVVPEIDLPGHITAALAAYPEYGCTGGPYETQVEYGVHDDVLCIGNEKTIPFVEDILEEVIQLFPSEYIHAGGDECPRTRWEKCPKCQALIGKMGWKDTAGSKAEDNLQVYFMNEIARFIESKGRKMIGWDEVLNEDLTPTATVMSWRNEQYGMDAARKGYDVIMAPSGLLYFSSLQVLDLPGDKAIRMVYDFDPVSGYLDEEAAGHLVGVQACLWAEDVDDMEKAEYRILPRMAALSETAWGGFTREKDYGEFAGRMFRLIKRYDKYGYTYHKGAFDVTSDYENDTLNRRLSVSLATLGDRAVYYTLDGSEPDEKSERYVAPFALTESAVIKAKVIMPGETDGKVLCDTVSVNKASFCPVTLKNMPDPTYTYKGASVLTDGLTGDTRYNTGRWLGFLKDMDAVIDLGEEKQISNVGINTDVAVGAAVMDITGMEVWCSSDGRHFDLAAEKSVPVLGQDAADGIYRHELDFAPRNARYVRVVARITPELPDWHTWPGGAAFIFVDEITVN